MQAIFNGKVIAQSDKTIVIEGSHYFPPESVNMEHIRNRQEAAYVCPWKGVADYYDVTVDGETAPGATWVYPEPKEAAKEITGYFAFWKGVEVGE
ncbi:MAG: DUF427 domain-containing protein [bacterium]|nr:DUF427 domain-containing protein [bacterium]MDZ4231217.1 DUF427 domain-containing protein [Patescibacteria group bacterium]